MTKYQLTKPAEFFPAGPKHIGGMPCVLCGGRHTIGSQAAYRVEPVDPKDRVFFVIGYAALPCVKAARLEIGA